jgi:ADP-ribosyl-[dinitrogen reductase] hydrolase
MSLDRKRGCLYGLAVGDALGAPIEFQSRGSFEPITDFRSGGPFGLNAGEWTDDTSLALALADSIGRGWNLNDQAENYLAWWQKGKFSVTGHCFDIGGTTRHSLWKFDETRDALNCADKDAASSGNGSIMRLAPVPIKYHNLSQEELAVKARESSLVTHASSQCLSSCEYLAVTLAALINGASAHAALTIPFKGLNRLVQEWIVEKKTYLNPETKIQGTGWVIKSLEAALWAFASTDSFEAAVLKAVNLGDDSDTTGAVCGQLAGAFYGESGIPQRWLDKLVRKDMIEDALKGIV